MRRCSDFTPVFIGVHRDAPLSPMKEGARVHHSYGSYAPSTDGSSGPRKATPSTGGGWLAEALLKGGAAGSGSPWRLLNLAGTHSRTHSPASRLHSRRRMSGRFDGPNHPRRHSSGYPNETILLTARGRAGARAARRRTRQGATDRGFRGAHLNPLGLFLNPLGLFLRTSTPFIWRILSAFLPA